MISAEFHCKSGIHCEHCKSHPTWRLQVFGAEWVCPIGADSKWTDEAVQRERERQVAAAQNKKRWLEALWACWLAEPHDQTAAMLIESYRARPCCAAKRMILQWFENTRTDKTPTASIPKNGYKN